MKFGTVLVALIVLSASLAADITHENQLSTEKAKAWEDVGNSYDGDYMALEGDHAGTSTVHIRSYGEGGVLYLWLTIIRQDDVAVLPTLVTLPKYERTRTKGTFKAHDKAEYIRFVSYGDTRGVIIGDRFHKQVNNG